MENTTETSLEDRAQQLGMLNTALAMMPDLLKFVPQIRPLVNMIDGGIESLLKDNEKMFVITRRNGVTRVIELNTKIDFTLTNNMKIEAPSGNPVTNNYEKNEWKEKLLNSPIIQTLEERYEKLPDEDKNDSGGGLSSLMGLMK